MFNWCVKMHLCAFYLFTKIACDVTILVARAGVFMVPNDDKHQRVFTGVLSPQLAYAYFICICYVIIKWMLLMIYRIELIQLAAKFYLIFFQPFFKSTSFFKKNLWHIILK